MEEEKGNWLGLVYGVYSKAKAGRGVVGMAHVMGMERPRKEKRHLFHHVKAKLLLLIQYSPNTLVTDFTISSLSWRISNYKSCHTIWLKNGSKIDFLTKN